MDETWFSRFALDAAYASIGSRKLCNDASTCPGTRQRHGSARQHGSQRLRESRARRGARAENVAYGVKTKQQAIALWWGSSGHAANMRLPGCEAVASAVGHNGTRYWAMVIGNWGSCGEGAGGCRFRTIADKTGFWPETTCPPMTQSGHPLTECTPFLRIE